MSLPNSSITLPGNVLCPGLGLLSQSQSATPFRLAGFGKIAARIRAFAGAGTDLLQGQADGRHHAPFFRSWYIVP